MCLHSNNEKVDKTLSNIFLALGYWKLFSLGHLALDSDKWTLPVWTGYTVVFSIVSILVYAVVITFLEWLVE